MEEVRPSREVCVCVCVCLEDYLDTHTLSAFVFLFLFLSTSNLKTFRRKIIIEKNLYFTQVKRKLSRNSVNGVSNTQDRGL